MNIRHLQNVIFRRLTATEKAAWTSFRSYREQKTEENLARYAATLRRCAKLKKIHECLWFGTPRTAD